MTASPRPTALRHLLVIAGIAVAATALAGCAPGAGTPGSTTPPASESPSTPDGGESPEPTPTTSGDTTEEMAANLADAIASGNTAAVEGYLTEPTRVVIAASEADMQYSAVDAVLALDYVQPGVGTWDFELPNDVLDGYAANPYYGEFFPEDAIVGRSDTAAVVSFVPNGDRIGTIFMSIDEALITDY